MQSWYSIISKNPTLSIYIWIIFCILPFFFIIQSFSFWQMIVGTFLILLYFMCHRFSFLSGGRCSVNEYVPSEYVFDLASLDALDVVVELE